MKICVAGKNDISVNALDYLLNFLKIDISNILAITNKTDNGVDSWQKSFKKFANDNDIKIVNLEDVYEIEDLIFLSLEFDKIIKPLKFKSKKLYNMHFSKLPAYKGMYTAILPIINGEDEGGVTFHRIDAGIDTGEIIAQKCFNIELTDTARDLYFKNLKYSFELFKEVINSVLDNTVNSIPQPFLGASYYSKSSINFLDKKIDLKKTSFEIYNQLRAYIFKEYQLPEIQGHRIEKVEIINNTIDFNTLEDNGEYFTISGIDGYEIKAYKDTTK